MLDICCLVLLYMYPHNTPFSALLLIFLMSFVLCSALMLIIFTLRFAFLSQNETNVFALWVFRAHQFIPSKAIAWTCNHDSNPSRETIQMRALSQCYDDFYVTIMHEACFNKAVFGDAVFDFSSRTLMRVTWMEGYDMNYEL